MEKFAAEFEMKDWENGDGEAEADSRPWAAKVTVHPNYHSDGTIDQILVETVCPDGLNREVWIEINKGCLVVHCYDPGHDEPLNVRINTNLISTDNDRNDGEGIIHG